MRIVFLTHCCPALFSNGGAEICWTILNSFKKKNYKITLIILGTSEEYEKSKRNLNKIKELVDDVILYKSEREDSLYNIFLKNPFYFFSPPQKILMPVNVSSPLIPQLKKTIKKPKIKINRVFKIPKT
jgi:hypothetical protein